jgi:hypothetical protein
LTLAAAVFLVLPAIASAATYNPSTTAQLTADIGLINTAGGSNTIDLTAGVNYNPPTTLTFTSTGTTTIVGAGESSPIGTGVLSPVPSDLIDVNAGTVVFQNVLLSGGEISPAYTINDSSTVMFDDSTIQGDAGPALGVEDGATATLNDSTIGGGADLGIIDQGTASLFNSTVAYNLAGVDDSAGTLNLTNSIIAENSEGDCLATVSLNGGTSDKSLDSDGTCGVAAPLSGVNPKLSNLGGSPAKDGGDVPVYPLQAGSAAIGAGDEAHCPSTDERGYPTNDPCDLGSEAYSPTPPVVTVPADITTTAPTSAGIAVSYTETATSSDGAIKTNLCAPASGSTFPIGTTTVSCTATDYHGHSTTKTFNVTVTLASSAQPQTITITSTAPTGVTVGSPTYTPSATASSGLPVAISLDSSSTGCTLSSGVVSFPHAGTCVIDFNQAGNSSYEAAPQMQQSIPIGKASQTITLTSTAPSSTTVGGPSYTPSATASSGLAVAISLDSSSTGCTLSSGTVSFTGAGTCVIDFNQAGNVDYSAAPQKQQSIAVGLQSQSITVTSTAPSSETVGGPTYTPTATASSGLPVAITLDSSSTGCVLSSGTVSFTATGTCVIDFNQAGNVDYSAAPQKQQSIAVGLQSQTITITSTAPTGVTVGSPTYTPSATASSGLPVAISLDSSSTGCTLSGGVVSFPHAGTCVIDFNQAGNGSYGAAPQKQQSVPIGKASQTITLTSTAPSSTTVGGPTYTPTATASSALPVAISLDSSSTGCTLSSGTVSFTATGTCVIDFNQAGNGDYSAAAQKQQSIAVGLQSQTITITSTAPSSTTVGGPSYTPTATASSGLAVAITLDSSSTGCTLSGGVVSFPHAGTCVIDFNQAGNGSYGAAPQKQQSVPIGKASQTITLTSTAPSSTTVGGPTYTPTATASSALPVAISLDSSSTGCTLSSGTVSFTATGTCVIDFNQAGNVDYSAAPQKQQSIAVGLQSQTITVTSTAPTGVTVGSPTYTPTASASSGLPVAISLDSSSTGCTLSSGVVSFPHAGTCVIDFNQAGNGSYGAAPQKQQSIPIGKAAQSITVTSTAPSSTTVGGPSYTPSATASSGLPVAISLDSSSTGCTLSSGTVSFTATGTCVIDFNQTGNSDYSAAPQKQQSIAVGLQSQTITITSTAPSSTTVGGPSYTPTATASSGLAVAITLDSSSTGCTLSSGVVSFSHAGTCVIDFNQAGNGSYGAAPQKQQSIPIGKAAQSITVTSTAPSGVTVGGSSYTPTATASSGLPVAISLDSSSSGCTLSSGAVSFTATGTCVIDFNQTGNGDYSAAPQKQQSIAVGQGGQSSQSITITSTAPTGVTVGSPSYTPSATASSGLPVAISLDSSSTGCTLSSGVVSFPHAGTCVIDFNQAGNGSYGAAPQKQQSVPIGKASQSITVTSTAPSGVTVGGSSYTPSATASSGLPVAITLDSSSTGCTLSSGVVSFPHAGTCVIDFNQAGNSDYTAASQKQQSIPIGKASQSITVTSTAPSGATVGGPTYSPTATAPGGTVAITLDGTSTGCTLSGGVVSFTAVGTCVIDFNQSGNSDYTAAAQKQQSIAVTAVSSTTEIDDYPSSIVTYSGSGWTHGHTGCQNIDCTESFSLTAGNYVQLSFTGTGVQWIAPKSNNGGYADVYIDGTLVATNVTTYAATTSYQQVIWSDSGLSNGPHTLKIVVLGTKPSASTNTYAQIDAFIVSTVGKQNQTITVTSTPPGTPTVGAQYTLSATGGASGNPVTFAIDPSSTNGACTISSSVVTFTGGGACVIDFNQAGNSTYNAAPQVQQTLSVTDSATGVCNLTLLYIRSNPVWQTLSRGDQAELVLFANEGSEYLKQITSQTSRWQAWADVAQYDAHVARMLSSGFLTSAQAATLEAAAASLPVVQQASAGAWWLSR